GEEEPPVLLNSPWYNIDDDLGIVSLTESAKSCYIPNKKSVRGRVEQLFHLNYLENPERFPVETVLIFYPGWRKDETRIASEKCSLLKPSPFVFHLKLEDGKKFSFDFENLSIKEEQ
ncbi:hypothetical protein JW926_14450, partial [Candidatus Sumerlaeota bacterium]|nr:hypothetical protein [Candidatus Sumerlaeota bacterium]